MLLFALWGGWLLYRHKLDGAKWFLRIAPWAVILPFLMNTAGWMLTENGRQPWIVQGLMKTANGVSPSVSATDIWISLVVFYLIFIVLGVADAWLMIRFGRKPLDHDPIAKLVDRGQPPSGRNRARPRTTSRRSSTRRSTMTLGDFWFVIAAIFWVGFFVLEGFDFGVGMLHSFIGRNDVERRVLVNTIGPVWDGNEVWLIVAGAVIFAAFPGWYATMFSAFYLALVIVLAALMVRGVSFEYAAQVRRPPVAQRSGAGP